MTAKVPRTEWLSRLEDKYPNHGYDFGFLPEYPRASDKFTLECPKHGVFETSLKVLTTKRRFGICPRCADAATGDRCRFTLETFKRRVSETHGDSYDLSLVDFTDYKSHHHKIKVVCLEHGVFTKTVKRFLQGEGCPHCKRKEVFRLKKAATAAAKLEQFKERNPHLDFSRAQYKGVLEPIEVKCPKHGWVQTSAKILLESCGCSACAKERLRIHRDAWIPRLVEVHGQKYGYNNLGEYPSSGEPQTIVCTAHSTPFAFRQALSDHATGHGCPRCKVKHQRSKGTAGELWVLERLSELSVEVEPQMTLTLGKQIIGVDAALPHLRVGLEFNGLYWHSSARKVSSRYHKNRSDIAEANGYRLIHIFEDDLKYRRHAVWHLLNYLVGRLPSVMARKTGVATVSHEKARKFYEGYHMQGAAIVAGQIHYGLLDRQGVVIAVMSFSQHASGRRKLDDGHWELVRFASSVRVQGGASKLFTHFVRRHQPKSVLSFSWNHLFDGKMYERLGFRLDKELPPDYSYVDLNRCRRLHKSGFQHSRLAKRLKVYDPMLSEMENCKANNFHRIYDCGKRRWLWTP